MVCENCKDGIAEECICFTCGRKGKLVKKNEKIREGIDNLIGLNHPLYSPIWDGINSLIENEIKLESFCNQ